jgi:RimJ/RimL family protein N-acetyltransferase
MNTFFFQAATLEEAPLLYKWRQDPLTQRMSLQQHEISYEQHLSWLQKVLTDPERSLFIFYDAQKKPLGTLRLDLKEEGKEISWTLAPENRGRGLGKQMLQAFLNQFPGTYIAWVKKENIASQKMCEAAGFKRLREQSDLYYYKFS